MIIRGTSGRTVVAVGLLITLLPAVIRLVGATGGGTLPSLRRVVVVGLIAVNPTGFFFGRRGSVVILPGEGSPLSRPDPCPPCAAVSARTQFPTRTHLAPRS